MPLPLLWIAGAITSVVVGYAAKKITEDDDSSSTRDDHSSYEEERRRREKAENEARKVEKKRKQEALETEFANAGEKYRRDIACALQELVSLHFESRGFGYTLRSGPLEGSEQLISWAHGHLSPEILDNLRFLGKNYAVDISPADLFKKFSDKIDKSTVAINDLKHKKLALKKSKEQLKKGQ